MKRIRIKTQSKKIESPPLYPLYTPLFGTTRHSLNGYKKSANLHIALQPIHKRIDAYLVFRANANSSYKNSSAFSSPILIGSGTRRYRTLYVPCFSSPVSSRRKYAGALEIHAT